MGQSSSHRGKVENTKEFPRTGGREELYCRREGKMTYRQLEFLIPGRSVERETEWGMQKGQDGQNTNER